MIFSASVSPANAAAALASIQIIQEEPERIEKLWSNTHLAFEVCKTLGLDTGDSATPIVPIYIRNYEKLLKVSSELFEDGIFVNPIVPPAVKEENVMLRFSFTSEHSPNDIEYALHKIKALLN